MELLKDRAGVMFTPKHRMLNAYKGIASDCYPVAPEFWNDYPAKVLRVSMVAFESFMIGCSYSCHPLIGKNMWRRGDKPYLKEIAEEIHKQRKLLHVHFHGKSMMQPASRLL